MQDMAHIYIKKNMGNGALAADKKHRVFFYKALHQVFGPGKIIYHLRRMLKDVEQEYPELQRAFLYFFKVIPKFHIGICRIDRRISIALNIIIYPYFLIPNN